ncbi:MAG: helix-turn-helix transcriptional regulator [Phycisphaerae bacterium]|nr:helix-turn-helix transcriptional regulator [Phycisphaerae bacterium]
MQGYSRPARQRLRGSGIASRVLRAIRVAANLTQRDLGVRLRQPQSWVHNCETGNRRVDVAEFCRWCAACGIDPHAGLQRVLEG